MRADSAHADFVAEVADGDIQNAGSLDFFKQNVGFGFERRRVFADCVVKFADAVFAGEFVGNQRFGHAVRQQFISLAFRLFLIFGERKRRDGNGVCEQLVKRRIQVKPDNPREIFYGFHVRFLADNHRFNAERHNQRARQKHGADNAVGFGGFVVDEHKAGHQIHQIALFERVAQQLCRVHRHRFAGVFARCLI